MRVRSNKSCSSSCKYSGEKSKQSHRSLLFCSSPHKNKYLKFLVFSPLILCLALLLAKCNAAASERAQVNVDEEKLHMTESGKLLVAFIEGKASSSALQHVRAKLLERIYDSQRTFKPSLFRFFSCCVFVCLCRTSTLLIVKLCHLSRLK